MLIFTLPSWYRSATYPENCIFIYEQMQQLKKCGHTIIVLSVQSIPIHSRKKIKSNIVKNNDNGITTYYTDIISVWPSKFKMIYAWSFKRALKRLIKKAIEDNGPPDIYYAHFSFPAGYVSSKLKCNIPLVVEEHFSGLMGKRIDNTLKKYIRKTVENANDFICVSHGLKDVVAKISGRTDIKVISNMISPDFVYKPRIFKNNFVFFSLGSLIPRKGFKELIEAFADEFQNEENVILRIGGSGCEEYRLKELIRKLNVQNKVQLIGQLSRSSTLLEFENCDSFVLASKAETYGLVYREALSIGRPIISTKHGGFGDDWRDIYGCLIDIDNREQLKRALRKIYDNYSSFDGALISKLCLKECSADSVGEQISKCLINCYDKHNRYNGA